MLKCFIVEYIFKRSYQVGIAEEVMNRIRFVSVDNDYNDSVRNTQRQRNLVLPVCHCVVR